MPTYEYRCRDCDHTFDAYQSFTDDALTECPECGGSLKKVFGNVGIAFKGSGFYKTDSRGGSKTATVPASGSESSSSSDSSSSGSGGSDSSSSSTDKAPAKTDSSTKKDSSSSSSKSSGSSTPASTGS